MEESRVIKNGRRYLESKRTIMLGISPGNPFFYKMENLTKMLQFARNNSDEKILLFLVDKISEHNYRAVGGKNPEKSARVKANRLRNKCEEAIQTCGIQNESVQYIDWSRDVESSSSYIDAFNYVKDLYQVNEEFQTDIQETTRLALVSLKNGREKSMSGESSEHTAIDLEEGVKYLLKELAFMSVVPVIYDACKEFVVVYHRPWPLLERFFNGGYDNISRPFLGFYVVE